MSLLDHERILQRQEELRLEFISTELDLATTFGQRALESQDLETVGRNTGNAHRAYDAAVKRLDEKPPIHKTKNQEINEKRQRVEELLYDLDKNEQNGR